MTMSNCHEISGNCRPIAIDHANYPKALRRKSIDALRFTIRDAREAMEANPAGAKAGYYADEILYAAAELRRRGCA